MAPKWVATNLGRTVAGVALSATLLSGLAACGSDAGTAVGNGSGDNDTDQSQPSGVLTAEAGAAARSRFEQFRQGGESAGARMASADASMALDCGPGEPYVPTPEEITAANADTDALAAVFDTYGVAYQRITDDVGFAYLEWDTFDAVAQSVHDSYWADRYPVQPPDPAELERVKADNDVVARYLDEAGIAYERTTDAAGWEQLTYDWEDPAAQEAVSAAYAELYPPLPPTAEELASIKADNDKLAAAFDAAGITYARVSDELGWEWLEWDWENPDTQAAVDAVFAELYPPVDDPCLIAEPAVESLEAPVGRAAEGDAVAEESAVTEESAVAEEGAVAEVESPPVASGDELSVDPGFEALEPTPEQVAQQDREIAALIEGFTAAGVTHEVMGESPWAFVRFDITNPASVTVVGDVLATRG